MRKSVSILTGIWALGLFMVHSHIALGQMTTATISGTVKDTTGAVLPGVAITIRNLETGITRNFTTDAQGRYTATNLTLGSYEVQAELQGFQAAVRSGIQLTVGREAVVPFELPVGAVAERIEVTGEAPLVDTSTSVVGGLVDTKQLEDLPINGRSFDKLARLETGVAFAKQGGGSGLVSVGGNTDRMSISGARVTQNLFLLDGTDISDRRGTSPGGVSGSALGMEAIREFRVLTSGYKAQYGRAAGGVVEVVSKSGTNEFHGSVFAYHRNDNLDAARWENNAFLNGRKPEFKRNQFGASLGGPIIKNRTFFFGSYEGLRERLGDSSVVTVPDAGARLGNLGTRTVTVDEKVKPYLALFPLPNGRLYNNGTGDFGIGFSNPTRQDYFTVRGDHQFSSNHSLMGRFTFDNSKNIQGQNPPVNNVVTQIRSEIVTLENTNILSPTLLNKIRFGLNRAVPDGFCEVSDAIPASLDYVPGQHLFTSGGLQVTGLVTLGCQTQLPAKLAYNSFQGGDDLSYVRGRHSFMVGGVVQRIQTNHHSAVTLSGHYRFRSLSDFLQNRTQSFDVQSAGTRNRYLRQTLVGTYIQDDFALRNNLTLNLGVRFEFITTPTEKFGKWSNLRSIQDTALTVGPPLFETTKNNWAPRVGFAWDPTGKGRTSVRGGFGLFHDQPISTYWYSVAMANPPFVTRAQIAGAPFPNGWDVAKNITGNDLKDVEIRGFRYTGTGYAMQYNLTVQRQFGTDTVVLLGYMGSQARKLIQKSYTNPRVAVISANGRKFFPSTNLRINPALGDVEGMSNDVNSSYNALITSLRKRFSAGYQFQASYTYSKVLSIQDSVHGADFSGGRLRLLDAYDYRHDRGPADHDVRHTFVLNSTYELPFGRNATGAVGQLLGGWQLGGIVSIQSGRPFSPSSAFPQGANLDGVLSSGAVNRPDVVPGRQGNAVRGGVEQYFDPFQFQTPLPGFYGNIGRNTMYDPGLITADLSLRKNANLTEALRLEFRAEFFNFLNKPNFGSPSSGLFDGAGNRTPTAGRITTTATTGRQIQFAMRLSF